MGKFSKKAKGDVVVLEKTKIGELYYAVNDFQGKPTLNIFTDRDDNYSVFRYQQEKAAIQAEAAEVNAYFAEHGKLPTGKKKAKKVSDDE